MNKTPTTFPVITTPRLQLDEITEHDIDSVYELFTSKPVLEYHDMESLRNRSEALCIIENFSERFITATGIRWAIRTKTGAKLMGTCGFKSWNTEYKSTVLGYDLLSEHWGKGYASEAVEWIINTGFAGGLPFGPLHRIQAETVPGNIRSEHLLQKLGFREEGLRKQAGFWKGEYHDLKCFGLLNPDG